MENDSCHSSAESENDCLDDVAELFNNGDNFDARENFDVDDNDASELERLKALSSTILIYLNSSD